VRPSGKHLKKKPIRSWSFVVLADAQEHAAAARSDEQIAVEQICPSAEHRFLRDGFLGEASGVGEAGFYEFFQAWVSGHEWDEASVTLRWIATRVVPAHLENHTAIAQRALYWASLIFMSNITDNSGFIARGGFSHDREREAR
jgi:hypothetical protein